MTRYLHLFSARRPGRVQQSGTERLSSDGQVHQPVRHVSVRVPGRLQGPVDRQRTAQRPNVRNVRPGPVQPPRRMLLPGRTTGVQVSRTCFIIRSKARLERGKN